VNVVSAVAMPQAVHPHAGARRARSSTSPHLRRWRRRDAGSTRSARPRSCS
jgi:hypothetical protein